MKTNRMLWSVLCAAAIISAPSVQAQDKAVTLARTYKAGDVQRYKVTVNASVMGMDVIVTSTAKNTIKEIKPNGDIVIEAADEGTKVNFGGQEQEQPAGPPVIETRSKTGKLVELKTDPAAQALLAPEIQKMSAMVSDIILSEKAVKAGDVWETEFDNPAVKGKKLTVKTTFVGMDKVEGKDLWKIKQSLTAETGMESAKVAHDYTTWLDPANGRLVKLEGTVKDIPTQFGPLSWTMKMEAVTEKANK
jgi:hypothetical protein